jgi:hypothetical protein
VVLHLNSVMAMVYHEAGARHEQLRLDGRLKLLEGPHAPRVFRRFAVRKLLRVAVARVPSRIIA